MGSMRVRCVGERICNPWALRRIVSPSCFQNVRKYVDSSKSQAGKTGRNSSNWCFCIPKIQVDNFSGSARGGWQFQEPHGSDKLKRIWRGKWWFDFSIHLKVLKPWHRKTKKQTSCKPSPHGFWVLLHWNVNQLSKPNLVSLRLRKSGENGEIQGQRLPFVDH